MNSFEESIIIQIQKNTSVSIISFMNMYSNALYTKYTLFLIIIAYILRVITFKQFISIFILHIILVCIKTYVQRKRPYNNNPNIINYSTGMFDEYSFPSGHAALIFLLYFILKNNYKFGNIYIVIPILMCISRVILGVHYISDVICGALLAFLINILS